MWNIINESPFPAKGAIRQDLETNRKKWLVAVKATFDIHGNGTLSISKTQEDVLDSPVFHGEEEQSSLRYDSDLFAAKNYVDLILNGTAYQPNGNGGKELMVGFSVGHWSKVLKIKGHRIWDRFLGVSFICGPQPFYEMPILYENAFGGRDDAAKQAYQLDYYNPVGTGYAYRKSKLSGKRMPNIEYPDFPTRPKYNKNKAAGFGAIPVHWKPRTDYAGTFDDDWQNTRAPILPTDFSARFYQSAPVDQQVNHLGGGEQVTLINLMPGKPEFNFRLPELTLNFITKIDYSMFTHVSTIKTLIVEPDVPRLIMVWQTVVDCQDTDHLVDRTTVNCRIIRI